MRRLLILAVFSAAMYAQRPAAPPRTAQAAAPIDLTGYWVSQIVDEWRFRVTPQKGDIAYLPLNAEARKVALAWDPDKDTADGVQCKAYGAVGVMQRPGRLHVVMERREHPADRCRRGNADASSAFRPDVCASRRCQLGRDTRSRNGRSAGAL